MNFLIDSLREMDSYNKLVESINSNKSPIISNGILIENMGHILYALKSHVKKQKLIVTYDSKRASIIYEDLVNLGVEDVYLFPEKEFMVYDIDAHSNEEINKRLKVLSRLSLKKNIIVVASIDSLTDRLISQSIFKEMTREIKLGSEIDLDEISRLLIKNGYERVPMVEGVGQFSIRGGILDYFPPDNQDPVRVEFFDIEVDSIRTFDIKTQRSIDNLEETFIMPVKEILVLDDFRDDIITSLSKDIDKIDKEKESKEISKVKGKFEKLRLDLSENTYIANREILIPYIPGKYLSSMVDYFMKEALVLVDEPKRVIENSEGYIRNYNLKYEDLFMSGELLEGHIDIFYGYEDINKKLLERVYWENSALLTNRSGIKAKSLVKFTVKGGQSFHKKIEILIDELNHFIKEKYRVIIMSGTEDRAERLDKVLNENGINSRFERNYNSQIEKGQVLIVTGSLGGGFEYPEIKFALINDKDIFGAGKKRKKRRKRKDAKEIVSFTDLKTGDYVVHENHGIGQYIGVNQLNIQGVKKDYLNIKYRDGDKLYVPIDQMHLIQKYIGSDSISPKVNKLSSAEWVKTKQKAMKAVEDMADELLELYAKREDGEGFKFSKDSVWQEQFEDYFPYEETEGQLRSIEEIKADMESNKAMDRLLCGDVGYGKTEVALRAAMKAVLDGKQVAFLVPTTILAQQHYNTIKKRFEKFPVEVAMLSRFKTAGEQKEDIGKIKAGMVDIVVGTHRLLSKDVRFKDLGLLIIDEEQRFGVKHKEKLKQLKESIDVLTLTATPIPRTLHMSLSGIRDMSVIEEPPEERYPVQTYVVEYNDQLIRDAIIREISRGGQVYFVYNRVDTIDKMAASLKDLVPEASFAVAHGQMNETILENVMMDFFEKEYDVLVCTTIIETGLDVPNVNTIIINDADKMGLSQLYQLRGRVGRANRVAYGYFTYAKDKVLKEVAESRLLAIKEFTEFGSGFKIAMRDLEIRGAGNLLGAQQHGQIEAIGYDLYVKFLNATIKKLRGEEVEEEVETIIDLSVDGYIKDRYIEDEEQKVEIYKKIGSVETIEDYRELIDELIDRFGDIPRETENLIDISYIRSMGSKNNIKSIIQSSKDVLFEFDLIDKISPELINDLSINYASRISFNLTKNPGFKYRVRKDVLIELKDLLEHIDEFSRKENTN